MSMPTNYPYAHRPHSASSSMSNGAGQSSARKQQQTPVAFPNANYAAGEGAMPGMYNYYNHNHHHHHRSQPPVPSAPRSQTKSNPPFLRSRTSTRSPSDSTSSLSTPRRSASATTLNPPFPAMAELPDLGVIDLSDGRNAERPQMFKATIYFPGAKVRRDSGSTSSSSNQNSSGQR